MIINNSQIEQVKKLLKTMEKPRIIKSQTLEFDRKMLEYGNFEIILNPDVNHFIAKLAKKKGIAIGFDLERIREVERERKSEKLSKMRKIIIACRKEKTKLALLNVKDNIDAKSLLFTLGSSSQQVKETTFIYSA